MVKSRGVEAYLVRYDDNIRYPEHNYPTTLQEATTNSAEVYVEAVADERYAIVVVLTPDFDIRGSSHVEISWLIDHRIRRAILTAQELRESFKSRGCFKYKVASAPVEMDGEWTKCGLNFNEMHIDEQIESSPDQLSYELQHIGRIKLQVTCGTVNGRKSARNRPPAVITAQSKEVVKNNHVLLSTRYSEIAKQKPKQWRKVFDLHESVGYRPVVLYLRFRSRTSLQMLKIIPDDDEEYNVRLPQNPRLANETATSTLSSGDASTSNKKRRSAEVSTEEMPRGGLVGQTPSKPQDTHQQQSAALIKREQNDDLEHEIDDDIAIVKVSKTSQRPSDHSEQNAHPSGGATSDHKRKRALAELRLEELDLEEKELKVKRQQLELKRQMLEMD